ncbi:MAG: glycosyltransferase [Desulfobacterales bacterium]|nr:glycosyltransferase [Desulfobacterales bacterium]
MQKPLVSIIIPTRNSGKTIGALLSSIRKQTYSDIEVIVVDGGSTDCTLDIAKEYKTITINNQSSAIDSRTENKNIGAREASGKYLYFVDADMELPPTVIEGCVKVCEEGFDALTLPEVSIGDGFWTKCRGLEKELSLDEPYKVACRFMKADIFSSAGEFDESMVFNEDIDLHIRVLKRGYRVKLPREIIVYHREVDSLTHILAKTFYYGKSAPKYIRRNPRESFSRVLIFRLQWLKHYKLLLKQPLIALGMLFMIFMKYAATLSAMVYSALSKFIGNRGQS